MSDSHEPSDKSARRTVLWLGATILGALVLYAILAWLFRMPRWLPTARASIGTVTQRSYTGGLALALLGTGLYALYALGTIQLWRSRLRERWIWLGATAAGLLLLACYPVTSTDVFDYFFRSRMLLARGANPYLVLPNQFRGDPLLRYIGWPNAPSAYGPLWEALSAGLVGLGGRALAPALLLYKALALGSHLAAGLVIARLVDEPKHRTVALYLWLLSPLVLWELVGAGHNDGLMVLSLLGALLAARRERYGLAVLALTAGTLIKFLPALFLPLVALAWMRRQPTAGRSMAVGAAAVLLFALPTAILYAPFWDLPGNFARLDPAAKLAAIWQGRTTTLRNLAVREGFLNASPLALLSYVLQSERSVAGLNRALAALALPAAERTDVRAAVSAFGSALALCGLLWQCWQVWFRRRPLEHAFLGLLLWYVLAGSQWFQPWYLAWLLALLVLGPWRAGWPWLTAWALMAQASYLLQFIVFPRVKLSGQTLAAQALYVVVIYALPLLVWLWRRYRRPPAQRAGAAISTPT